MPVNGYQFQQERELIAREAAAVATKPGLTHDEAQRIAAEAYAPISMTNPKSPYSTNFTQLLMYGAALIFAAWAIIPGYLHEADWKVNAIATGAVAVVFFVVGLVWPAVGRMVDKYNLKHETQRVQKMADLKSGFLKPGHSNG